MSVDSRIMDALLSLGYEVEHGTYTGDTASTYFTFNYQTLGIDFGDDAPWHERVLVQVHLYSKLNVNLTGLITRVKQQLFEADFTWPDVTDISDDTWRHFEFTCETAQGIVHEAENETVPADPGTGTPAQNDSSEAEGDPAEEGASDGNS